MTRNGGFGEFISVPHLLILFSKDVNLWMKQNDCHPTPTLFTKYTSV